MYEVLVISKFGVITKWCGRVCVCVWGGWTGGRVDGQKHAFLKLTQFSETVLLSGCWQAADQDWTGNRLQEQRGTQNVCFCVHACSALYARVSASMCLFVCWAGESLSVYFLFMVVCVCVCVCVCRGGLHSGVFSPLARGGINFIWQPHAVVIWFKGRCYYPDLAVTAGDWMPNWQLNTLL